MKLPRSLIHPSSLLRLFLEFTRALPENINWHQNYCSTIELKYIDKILLRGAWNSYYMDSCFLYNAKVLNKTKTVLLEICNGTYICKIVSQTNKQNKIMILNYCQLLPKGVFKQTNCKSVQYFSTSSKHLKLYTLTGNVSSPSGRIVWQYVFSVSLVSVIFASFRTKSMI